MGVVHHAPPASSGQMTGLIEEVKNLALAVADLKEGKYTNELHYQKQSFSEIYGQGANEEKLKVYVERYNTTFNVYWMQIEEAAEYIVEVYKGQSMRWYKLTEISADRSDGYVAITNLVGDGYVFRVVAKNRSGEELAKSAGMIIGGKSAE